MNTTSSHYLSIHHNICSTVLAPTILRYITIWSLGSSVQRAGDRVSTGPLGISHRALSLSPLSLPSLLRRLRPGPGPEISRAGGPLPSQNAKTAAAEGGGGRGARGCSLERGASFLATEMCLHHRRGRRSQGDGRARTMETERPTAAQETPISGG